MIFQITHVVVNRKSQKKTHFYVTDSVQVISSVCISFFIIYFIATEPFISLLFYERNLLLYFIVNLYRRLFNKFKIGNIKKLVTYINIFIYRCFLTTKIHVCSWIHFEKVSINFINMCPQGSFLWGRSSWYSVNFNTLYPTFVDTSPLNFFLHGFRKYPVYLGRCLGCCFLRESKKTWMYRRINKYSNCFYVRYVEQTFAIYLITLQISNK